MKESNLRILQDFCGGRAESEIGFLTEAFVLAKDYQDALHAPFHSPVILLGRKGTGKSALLKYIDLRASDSGVRALYLKPDDIPLLDSVAQATDTATIKRKAYEALVTALSVKVGTDLRGVLNRKDKKLFDKAIRDGARTHDAVQACLQTLASVGSVVKNIDFTKLVPDTNDASTNTLRGSLQANFARNERAFFLLLDDVDQVASLVNHDQVNRIWGLILAAQRLTEELPNFKTVISLRTEVWTVLSNDQHGQRDQVDHIRPLIRLLDPGESQIKAILERRLEVARNHLQLGGNEPNELIFFEDPSVLLPTSEGSKRSWPDFIAKSSRGRPRDALQLLGILAEESRNSGFLKITQSVVNRAAAKYSSQRIDDLTLEYAIDCPVVREICNTFSSLEFTIGTEALKDHLVSLPSRFSIRIRGTQIRPDSLEDVFTLWGFVHEMGICNPRVPDNRQEREFRHINHSDDPHFVSQANWNEMQKVVWEIHPAYRSYLIDKRKEDEARTGISLRKFFRKDRKASN
ncbi:MAG: ATP-binding protein [Pseudomonadota bacterium]